MKTKVLFLLPVLITVFILSTNSTTHAEEIERSQIEQRMILYKDATKLTEIPWYILGAVDQYERNTKYYRDYCPREDELISVCFSPQLWGGLNNPLTNDSNPYTIGIFHGFGVDGDSDGVADRLNPYDRLSAMLQYILGFGDSEEAVDEALRTYYQTEKGVEIIYTIAKLFEHYDTIQLSERVFPIPRYYEASYSNNFGTGRSWGGARVHEGVDIFAHYGTPVVSTSYGVVEIIGWNEYGGYRVGIRDMYNTYQYYAHLNRYAKGLKAGDIVEPGQIIGYVGSTGYGKEGTRGKFPPHLHYGFYKFDGRREWSFNPYIYIRKWPKVKV